ncbi:hypothetical protein TWF730_003692 [Orbilia blumenaviensis]|uniref:Uncharacterized protein n=1 Tax=Orbilia blumenaviensis TaxID=1796055 RepID=A0AAV9U340_9PEZI
MQSTFVQLQQHESTYSSAPEIFRADSRGDGDGDGEEGREGYFSKTLRVWWINPRFYDYDYTRERKKVGRIDQGQLANAALTTLN